MFRKFLLLFAMLAAGSRLLAADALLEYKVKAVCVLNAARFVSWPSTAFSGPESPLVIGVLGDNPFGSSLQDVVRGETVQKRSIIVRRVSLAEAAAVHILFVSPSERNNVDNIVRALANSPVLTISDIDGFAQNGGMLGLGIVGGKLRLKADSAAARRAQLKISSQFLLLAK
jgi:hypothetical protein